MMLPLTRSSVLHPFLFAVIPILTFISWNITEIALQYIALTFLIIIAAVTASWYLLNLVLKSRTKSGLMVSLGIVLFFSYGHMYNIIFTTFNGAGFGVNRYLLPAYLAIFIVGLIVIFKTKNHHKEFTTIANGMALVVIAISVFNISAYVLEDNNNLESFDHQINHNTPHALDYTPNVYYIILDTYASSKILEKAYGFDNSEFLSELTTRGFHVSKSSHSNYQSTLTSLTSSLNMEYLTTLSEKTEADLSYRMLYSLWNDNKVTNIFKSYNYTTVTMPVNPGIPRISDYELCQSLFLFNEADIVFWETTLLNPIFRLFDIDQHQRDKILCKFDELTNLHNSIDEPFFVYAHFLLPHTPFVFGPNGEPIKAESLAPGAKVIKNYKSKYLDQVKFSNKKIIEVIDKILWENTKPPIIILQSDHGPSYSALLGDSQVRDENTDFGEPIRYRMSILNAYYLPPPDPPLVYDHITPVNSFRLIFNAYFNENFEMLENRSYRNDGFYNFTDVTDILMADFSGHS